MNTYVDVYVSGNVADEQTTIVPSISESEKLFVLPFVNSTIARSVTLFMSTF